MDSRWLSYGVAAFLALAIGVLPRAARATPTTLTAVLAGAQEVPPTTSTAIGSCSATVDPTTGSTTFSGTFEGLSAPATGARLQGLAPSGQTAPVLLAATMVTSATSGSFAGSGALSALDIAGFFAGEMYCDVTDAAFTGGEIRGQLAVSTPALPLPFAGWLPIALGAAALAAMGPRRNATAR